MHFGENLYCTQVFKDIDWVFTDNWTVGLFKDDTGYYGLSGFFRK
jgi:hypothetical protein